MKDMLISIDPGKRSIAWALWVDSALFECGYLVHAIQDNWVTWDCSFVEDLKKRFDDLNPLDAVVELPRIYPRDRNKRPNDLIDLAAMSGMCATISTGTVSFVHPQQWKGQVPKSVTKHRVLQTLCDLEKERAGKWLDNHNVIDAIGIGLWKLKRG